MKRHKVNEYDQECQECGEELNLGLWKLKRYRKQDPALCDKCRLGKQKRQ